VDVYSNNGLAVFLWVRHWHGCRLQSYLSQITPLLPFSLPSHGYMNTLTVAWVSGMEELALDPWQPVFRK
jgi:hypothetical protein